VLTPYEVFWIFGIPAALFSWYHIIRHVDSFILPRREIAQNPYPRIIFSIAARRLTSILQGPVDSINHSCAEVGFSNYEIKLVVDSIDTHIEGVETIVVPKEFNCMSKYKARALHYALRYLPNTRDVWILHLDEDALVTPQCVTSIVNYIRGGGNPVANGPSVFVYDGNILTFFAEAQRQWTFYWLKDQLMTSTVHWLNGSNLLIRSDVEQSVGWDFINCFISEDSRFGYESTKKLGKIFGWHGGLTIEKPAATVNDVLKQRTRWFFGSILNLRYVPRGRLPRRIYSILIWLNGFILTTFFFILILGIYHEPWFSNQFIINGISLTAIFWISRYEIGVYQNLRLTSLHWAKKALLYIGIIPLVPVVDFICTFPVILAFIKRPRAFEITAKKSQDKT
jgi:egghead protein (zeste-white 4 protein)